MVCNFFLLQLYTNEFGDTTPIDEVRFLDVMGQSRAKAFGLNKYTRNFKRINS